MAIIEPQATDRSPRSLVLTWHQRLLERVLWWAVAFVIVCDVIASVGDSKRWIPYSITRFFDGDVKVNVPTTAKALGLLSVALLMLLLSSVARKLGGPDRRLWLGLAGVVGFAFVDESIYLHQTLSEELHKHFHTHGILTYAWTAVYLPVLLLVAILALPGLRHLESRFRWRLLAAGGVYGIGAVAMEPFKSRLSEETSEAGLGFHLVAALSDSLQVIGLALLIILLTRHIGRHCDRITVNTSTTA